MFIFAVVILVTISSACSSGDSSTPPGARDRFPPRPANVDPSHLQPCMLLSAEQTSALRLSKGRAGTANVNGERSPVCTWLGTDGIDFNVQQIPIGAEIAATVPDAAPLLVNEFGAVKNVPTETMGGTPFCQVTIDIASNQSIRVQARTRPRGPAPGLDEQCRRATTVASMVMTTVVATASR